MPAPNPLNAQKVAELLAAEGHELAEEQIAAIVDFLRQVGSVEKAQQALQALCEVKKAA